MSEVRFELMACTATLMDEISRPESTRRDVAKTYALALRSSEKTDWKVVNTAIIDRWSVSGLNWIKQQAHSGKCFE
jgi:hypothetical protein